MHATYIAKSTVPIATGPRHKSAFWPTSCGSTAANLPTSLWAARKPSGSSLKSLVDFRIPIENRQSQIRNTKTFRGCARPATIKEIEAQGWSLNPGRYVGVASGEALSDEDFKEQLESLNEELETLNAQARDFEPPSQET